MIKTLFVIIQMGIICLFALFHFLIGLKRGYKKTLWYFSINTISVLVLFFVIGYIPFYMLFNEEIILNLSDLILGSNSTIIQEALEMGGYDMIVAVLDFILKIVTYVLCYWILRFFIIPLISKKTWKNFKLKKLYPTEKKQKFLGGFFGLLQGITFGFLAPLPLLTILNVEVMSFETGELLESNIDQIQENEVIEVKTLTQVSMYLRTRSVGVYMTSFILIVYTILIVFMVMAWY